MNNFNFFFITISVSELSILYSFLSTSSSHSLPHMKIPFILLGQMLLSRILYEAFAARLWAVISKSKSRWRDGDEGTSAAHIHFCKFSLQSALLRSYAYRCICLSVCLSACLSVWRLILTLQNFTVIIIHHRMISYTIFQGFFLKLKTMRTHLRVLENLHAFCIGEVFV